MRNGWSSLVVPVYSPGRRRKKKAIVITSAMALAAVDGAVTCAICRMYITSVMGTGFPSCKLEVAG